MTDPTSNPLDAELLKARGGDMDAFAVLVRAHERPVYSLALRMLGDRQLAEDLAQDVFMQLHDKLQSLESAAHLSFWLRRVMTHRVIDHLRRRPKLTVALEEIVEPAAPDPGDPLLQRQLRGLLLQLSPDARAVMLLRYQEDLDPLDIASTLDMPINTVKSHLKRSLDTMREKMLDHGASPLEGHAT